MGNTRSFTPVNQEHATYWTTSYPIEALLPLMGLVRLVESKDLFQLNRPVLMLYSKKDRVVDSRRIEECFAKIGASRKTLMEVNGGDDPSHHVLAGGILSLSTTDRVADEIVRFVQALINEKRFSRDG